MKNKPSQKEVATSTSRWLLGEKIFLYTVLCGIIVYVLVTRWELSQIRQDVEKRKFQHQTEATIEVNRDIVDEVRFSKERAKRNVQASQRSATTEAPATEPSPGNPRNGCRRRTTRTKEKVAAGHLEANIDRDQLAMLEANGHENTLGNFTIYGFLPFDQVYRFWRPSPWTNQAVFRYNESTGKVTVAKAGYYLIYSQMMFHGPSAQKSYGIHVNDEWLAFVEAISFEAPSAYRHRRGVPDTFNPMEDVGIDLGETENDNEATLDGDDRGRPKRAIQSYAKFRQSNTFAVTKLTRGDQVFLKAFDPYRTVIPERHLCFWGLVKLG